MKDLLKKYWFVAVVAVALMCFIVAYAVNTAKNREITVSTFKDGDNYVVASVDGDKYITADELYESLYSQFGLAHSWRAYQSAVIDKAVETTSAISTNASSYASYLLANNTKENIDAYLRSNGYTNGYDDVLVFCTDQLKQALLLNDFYTENFDVYGAKFVEDTNPRDIYHILVKVADITQESDEDGNTINVANPSEEETAKLNAILSALEDGKFEDVAAQYSEDSSAANGGHIGIIHTGNASNYDSTFADCALNLDHEQVSDVIVSQFGYHILYAKEANKDVLTADSSFMDQLATAFPNTSIKVIFDKGQELGFEIVSEDLLSEMSNIIAAAESEVGE